MNKIEIYPLKLLRKLYAKSSFCEKIIPDHEIDPDIVSNLIYNMLIRDEPCMISRFGDGELLLTANYYGIKSTKHSILKFIKGESPEWWWNNNILSKFKMTFVPYNDGDYSNFGELMLKDASLVDILGEWQTEYRGLYFIKDYISQVKKVHLLTLEPYWSKNPWTRALKDKKVLVINMFADLIEKQYKENRQNLFKDPNVLPQFELKTIKAINVYDRVPNRFYGWFDELKWMEDEMDKTDYDIVLIGCGAYGFPLAAHAKIMGKKAVHLGGALQLLFGIKGKRWEDPNYGAKTLGGPNKYNELFNEYWIRPDKEHTPEEAKSIENGCYW